MTTYARILLSGSTSGKPIPVVAVATPGTLIHTAVAGAAAFDETYIYASNVTGAAATLTIEYGGAADPGDLLVKAVSVPANSGPVAIAVGQSLNGGLVVRAFSGTASALNITGWANRIS